MSPRYANYDNSNQGETQFTSSWVDNAKYQQLRGYGSRSNDALNQQYAAAKGGAETGTVADDGDGVWKLIKQTPGTKSHDRRQEYKNLAALWQAAGYDVRVQDHNPNFEGGTAELAVRIGTPVKQPEKPKPVPVQLSKEAATAIGRAAAYDGTIRPRYGDYVIGGDESVMDDFDKDAAEKIGEALKPYFDDDVNRDEAQAYADKYKLELGDDLKLTAIA